MVVWCAKPPGQPVLGVVVGALDATDNAGPLHLAFRRAATIAVLLVGAMEQAISHALELDTVLDALPRAVIVSDRSGVIRAWNAQAEELYGWTRQEAVGAGAAVVVGAREPDEVSRIRELVLDGQSWTGEMNVLRRDGESLELLVFLSPARDASGAIVGTVMAAEDLTERRQLEHYAAELNDHFRLALEAGELGTFRWDLASGVTTWDSTLERLFGLEPGTFDGTFDAWVALLHPDDVDSAVAVVEEAVENKSGYQMDHRVTWPDGSVHWLQGRGKVTLNDHGEVTGTIGCTADITVRKTAEFEADERARAAAAAAASERLQRERLEFLAKISRAALASRDHREFMRSVTAAAVPNLGDWCALHFLPVANEPPLVEVAHANPDRVAWAHELVERYPFDPLAPTGVAAVVRTGEAEFIPDVSEQLIDELLDGSSIDRVEAKGIIDALDLTSAITVPLQTKRGVLGAMQFVSAESKRHYDESDLALAKAAAGRIADALDNMWLTDQQRHIAATLQAALLPPALPDIPHVQAAVRYWPAGAAVEVGGDFYDIFRLNERRWAVVIGDVCGTGPNGAAVTGIARHTIRAAARHGQDHNGVLDWLNDALLNSNRGLFCTACYATLDRESDEHWSLTNVSGGHPLPVLVRSDGRPDKIGRHGTLLGSFESIRHEPAQVSVEPGDTLIFFTDGVTDVPPPHGLTDAEVGKLFADAAQANDAEQVADAIQQRLSERLPMEDRHDDVALVVLRFDP